MGKFGLVLLLAATAFGQTVPVGSTAACGRDNVSFKVKLDDSQHTFTPPDAGKARLYFFHDAGTNNTLGYPTGEGRDGRSLGGRATWQLVFLGGGRAGRSPRVHYAAVIAGGAAL